MCKSTERVFYNALVQME